MREGVATSTVVDRLRDLEAQFPGGSLSLESGQATAEYALLTGVIALVIALVAAWATSTGKVAALLDAVFDGLIRAAG